MGINEVFLLFCFTCLIHTAYLTVHFPELPFVLQGVYSNNSSQYFSEAVVDMDILALSANLLFHLLLNYRYVHSNSSSHKLFQDFHPLTLLPCSYFCNCFPRLCGFSRICIIHLYNEYTNKGTRENPVSFLDSWGSIVNLLHCSWFQFYLTWLATSFLLIYLVSVPCISVYHISLLIVQ